MFLKRIVMFSVALSIANTLIAHIGHAFEFDSQCLELRKKLIEASGTEQDVAEETETDPRLLSDLLTNKSYVCTSADKVYLKRQVEKDKKIVAQLELIVATCPQYLEPDPLRQQLKGEDAKPFSEANEILSAFSDMKRFLSFATQAQKIHLRGMDICDGKPQ